MILADSSVWIDYFNGNETSQTKILDIYLAENTVIMGDLILLELLQGFRKPKQYELAKSALLKLTQYQMLNTEIALQASENYRLLRSKGLTIRKTADVIIATFCIETNIPLLHQDRDFKPFEDYLHLRNAEAHV